MVEALEDGSWRSAIDDEHAVPGDVRPQLALRCASELVEADGRHGAFDTPAWEDVRRHDAAGGFGTRLAGRALLRRSDGRFLLFRYPFRDGSFRFVIPGGGAEPGETALDAVRREVHEETGTAPRDLRASGLVLYHLLASTIYGAGRTPTIQYSPVFLGTIDDELPDTGGREAHWYDADEFRALPRRPITEPILRILTAADAGGQLEPHAVWLPA